MPVAAKYVTKIVLHTGNGTFDWTSKCGSAGPGLYTPGNFGWLDTRRDRLSGHSRLRRRAAFYFAGYKVPGAGDDGFTPTDPSGTATVSCSGEKDCMWGWFVTPIIPAAQVPRGTSRGPKTTKVVG